MSFKRNCLLITITFLACQQCAVQKQTGKPDFSGDWSCDISKSKPQVPTPQSMSIRITHQEPRFHELGTITYRESTKWKLDLTVGGNEVISDDEWGRKSKREAHWERDELVITTQTLGVDKAFEAISRYRLSADGKTLTVKETRHHDVSLFLENLWVLNKQ